MADEQHKQHLYLVFDDWSSGYSIRKLSLSLSRRSESSSESDSCASVFMRQLFSCASQLRLRAKPPVFMRVSAPRGFPGLFTSAFGTKIMMIHPGENGTDHDDDDDSFMGVPAVDVKDRTITFEAEANAPAAPIYIPVSDDRLFALDIGTFEVLRKPPAAERSGGQQPWEWQGLPFHPFWIGDVSSYVVFPDDDGCSILVGTTKNSHATCFVFDTKENAWRKYGDWTFPFTGRGYYDTSLKGFVGLSKNPETLGYLYCCTITMATGLDFKCTNEKLYNKNLAEGKQHVSATLVHMSPGKFCLVECVSIDGNRRMTDQELDQEIKRWVPPGADPFGFMGGGPQGGRVMYRLKTFSLTYDMSGDLKLQHCKVRCCSLPHDARIGSLYRDPVAFWL